MKNNEKIMDLDNARILLNMVETKGEKNLEALLNAIKAVKRVSKAMKEEEDASQNKSGEDV